MSIEKPIHRPTLSVPEMRGIVVNMIRSHLDWLRAMDVIYDKVQPGMQPDWNDLVLANQLRRQAREQTEVITLAIHKLAGWEAGNAYLWSCESEIWRWVAKALAAGEFDQEVEMFGNHRDGLDRPGFGLLKRIFEPAGVVCDCFTDARGKNTFSVRIGLRRYA